MKVSCFCCTYGRPPAVLAEAVESFLRQDYPGVAELVILNDLHGQRLHLDRAAIPGNRVIVIANNQERYRTLGAKFCAAVDLCSGTVLFPWEDDDIYLPWRISYSLERMVNGYYHTNRAWYEHGGPGVLVSATNLFHCNMAFTRELYDFIGGYDSDDTPALDQSLHRRLMAAGVSGQLVPWDRVHYIYRWQWSGSWHGSGMGDATPTDEAGRRTAMAIAARQVPVGDVSLRPAWSRDWLALAQKAAVRTAEVTHG
jgi:glycosyltransferase involved in cell wall biosynthesis